MMDRRLDVVWVILVISAVVVGVWLGMAGVDISPVFTEVPSGAGGPGR
jgi:hypothetical protein